MEYAETKFVQEKKPQKILYNFEIKTVHSIPTRESDLVTTKKKKREDFATSVDHRLKIKKSEKLD